MGDPVGAAVITFSVGRGVGCLVGGGPGLGLCQVGRGVGDGEGGTGVGTEVGSGVKWKGSDSMRSQLNVSGEYIGW